MTISAKVIQSSIAPNGTRITTFELEYPRFIHSEKMTHRLFSRNAASSRAVPINKQIDLVLNNTAQPVHWGSNQPGMRADQELPFLGRVEAGEAWHHAMLDAVCNARRLSKLDLHKQVVNRVLEPFSHMKTVVTATEWANFFHLRDHEDAQPEIRELAKKMKHAQKKADVLCLQPGEWHVPYVKRKRNPDGKLEYFTQNEQLTCEEATQVSASCCAQVSYRVLNQGKEKALEIFNKLVDTKPVHASPFEHQAMPMVYHGFTLEMHHGWEKGTTHLDKNNQFWSGNFRHWTQHRQLLSEHTVW